MWFYAAFFIFTDTAFLVFYRGLSNFWLILGIGVIVQYVIFMGIYDAQPHKSISTTKLGEFIAGALFLCAIVGLFILPIIGRFIFKY